MLLDGLNELKYKFRNVLSKVKSLLTVITKITNKFGKHGVNDCGVTGSNPESVY